VTLANKLLKTLHNTISYGGADDTWTRRRDFQCTL